MELEPIKPPAMVKELAHWQDKQEQAQAQVDYCQAKINACTDILRASNIIWVEDERWQRGSTDSTTRAES